MTALRPLCDADPDVVIARRLRAAAGGYVSGEDLGAELGLTRAGIARHVAGLRHAGFEIDASTRLGYKLAAQPDTLAPARLLPQLATRWLGRRAIWTASCVSTNDLALEAARAGEAEGLVVIAETQIGGRGRLGRGWHSPPGGGVYLTALLRPDAPPSSAPPLTLLAGAALAEAVAAFGAGPRLKWPNDLLLPDPSGALRKAGGILTEMASEMDRVRHVVVGIGVNANVDSFPRELASRATSLSLSLGGPVDRPLLACRLLESLEAAYDRMRAQGPAVAVSAWRTFADLPSRVRIRPSQTGAAEIAGVAEDVDDDGALRVCDDAGKIHRVLSGELDPAP